MFIRVFSSGPAETNTYLIACALTRKAAIIDAPLGSTAWLEEQVASYQLCVETLLLTHSHWDHIADAALIKQTFNIPLAVHPLDAPNVAHPGADKLPLLIPIQPTNADLMLEQGQHLQIGQLDMQVIHTPGHSPGGVCFYFPQEQTLFSGDTLFEGTIGRVNFPTSSPSAMWRSLKQLAELPPETIVYPGHGEATTIGQESWLKRAEQRFSKPQ